MGHLGEQLLAARHALESARIAVDQALAMYDELLDQAAAEEAETEEEEDSGEVETEGCTHPNKQDASSFGNAGRAYCDDCETFINRDGTEVPANPLG